MLAEPSIKRPVRISDGRGSGDGVDGKHIVALSIAKRTPVRLLSALVVLLLLAVVSAAAATAAGTSRTPGRVTVEWAASRGSGSVSGLLNGRACRVRVRQFKRVRNVHFALISQTAGAPARRANAPGPRTESGRRGRYSCSFDTSNVPNGRILVRAIAVDKSGHRHSASHSFTVANPVEEPAPTPTPPVEEPAPTATGRWFSPTSFWNRQLPGEAPLASKSAGYVSELVRQVEKSGPWINTDQYSVPVYTVPASQPTVKVIQKQSGGYQDGPLNQAFAAVPVPPGAKPAAGTDKHMVIYQPSTDKMWEFWDMEEKSGQWTAQWGGAMQNVSTDKGYYDPSAWTGAGTNWGATATSLPLVGGLMTIKELEAGKIEHTLALAIPEPSPSYVWPAQRSDGFNNSTNAIPEGTIFRLPASLNIAALNLPPITREIATAAQRYGMVVRDVSGCVCLYGQDPTPTGTSPYYGSGKLFEGLWPNEFMRAFPWGKLQAVAPDLAAAIGLSISQTLSAWG